MKNKEQFDWAIGVLVKAYFNETLRRLNCAACAVGNLVAAANNYEKFYFNNWTDKEGNAVAGLWAHVHRVTTTGYQIKNLYRPYKSGDLHRWNAGKAQLESTGYTIEETAKIERAFETGGKDMFHGLMAVVDCLIEIHEGTEEEKEEAKEMFSCVS